MKSTIRELATDLKAATLIGDQESMFFALNGVRALDDDALSVNNLLLLGRAVRALPMNTLKELLTDVDPAVRGVAAVGLAENFGSGKDPKAKFLRRGASDPHSAVREAFAEALAAAGEQTNQLPMLNRLAVAWLEDDSADAVHTGLLIFPRSAPSREQVVAVLAPLHDVPDQDLRLALVECLTALVGLGYQEQALTLLASWAAADDPNTWVITRALSTSWAIEIGEPAVAILKSLARQVGMVRPVARAIERYETPED